MKWNIILDNNNNLIAYVGIDAIKIQKDSFQQLNPFPTLKYNILQRSKLIVYSTDDLSKILRPAMVTPENAVTSNHYLHQKADIEMARFTAIPFAFLDRRDWNDIRRGVTDAETEMQVGESKRRIPFLTNCSLFRNEVLRKTIYHGFELQLYEETNVNDQYEYDGEYEDGLENEQLAYLENI